jgi:hypothetical protein
MSPTGAKGTSLYLDADCGIWAISIHIALDPLRGGSSMSLHRVALIFDDRVRPDSAGVYGRKALAGLVEAVLYQPGQAEAIPSSGFELYLSIDDDTEHRLPESLHRRAYWAIYSHRDHPARFERSVVCDT